ncbi:amino acid adenylation domain-containing protein [Microcoleus sp. MOSTC5]|uniref:amino acid adenylation domain-containing protein n=1 Tax=Microcoleus sp. MOSTC5 TaxID=3055378 RepID=UPI002FCFE061
MSKGNIEDFYPLSPAQQGILFHSLYQPESGIYFGQLLCVLRGDLNVSAFRNSWQKVVDRHPILRTCFLWENVKEPVQVVRKQAPLSWQQMDWRSLSTSEQQQQLETFLKADGEQGFDLTSAPLIRIALAQLETDTFQFILSHHHLVLDGWSQAIVIKEVFAFYEAECQGAKLQLKRPRSYRDYIAWLQQQDLAEAESFWRQTLQGFTTPTSLVVGGKLSCKSGEGSRGEAEIKLPDLAPLQGLVRQYKLTVNTLVQGAWALLVSRYSGEEDIIFGVTVSGRSPELIGAESMVGMLINTLPVRVSVPAEDSIISWLQQLQSHSIEVRQYEYSPLVEIQQRWSKIPLNTPLFESIVVFENYPVDPSLQRGKSGLEIGDVRSVDSTNYPITLMAVAQSELALKIMYDRSRFEQGAIERMLGHLQVLLEGMAANPHQPLKNLPLLTPAEKQQILVEWNGTKADYPQDNCIHQLFEQQAQRTPDAVAVVFEDQKVTYRELNERANQLAHYLQQLGVKPEVLVGICVERSLLTIVGILGILKAGGAYVPLDPANPIDRTAFILQDASVSVLLTQETLLETLPEYSGKVVCLEADSEAITQNSTDNPNSHATAENLAYVIYTSGSTGQPKGVLVTHANVVRLFAATQSWYNFSEGDVWTLFHSYAFDFSVWELWGALIYGGRLVIVPYFVARSPIAFYELLCRERVTVLNQTPSAFRQLMQAEESVQTGNNLSLRWVIFGGEALELPSLKPWFERHGDRSPQLVNMYGITETTVHVTYRPLSLADLNGLGSVIGCAIPDLQLYILDKNRQLVPVGIPGEMYVGGAGVARGYLNRPDLTAERFISNPFSENPEARLYKTGDLARYLPNGDIEYLGRIDTQVKLRGFRIELGEIEAQLNRHPAVRESAVLLREDAPGDKRLIAYIVAPSETTLTTGELHVFLKEKLPDYMVPAAFVLLEALPLTVNGKVDRRSLPEPDTARPDLAEAFVAPGTAEEKALAEIWEKILGVEKVGIRDNFFALGGDSIRSIQVQSLAQKQGLRFSLQQLFQYPTIEAIVRELKATEFKELEPSKSQAFSLILPADKQQIPDNVEDAYPLTALQMGMIFHSEYSQESAIYHDIFSFHLKAPLEVQVLQAAIECLVKRHAVLRTSFQLTGFSESLQLVHQKVEIPLQVEDLRHLSNSQREAALNAWLEGERNRHFDWKTPPLMQFQIHRYTQETFQLSFAFHHAILDGWSVGLVLTELFQQYFLLLGKTGGSAAPLPQIAFRDFVAMERASVASEEHQRFWKEKLSDCTIAVLPRWQKFPREARIRQICTHNVAIPPEISEGLKQLANSAGVPIKSVLLAAHLRVLSLLSGQSDVLTGFVANGRPEETDGERICGLFLNTLPFRLQLSGGTWIDLVQQVFEAERELLPYRRYPLAEIQRTLGGQPLFETAFNYVNIHVYQGLQTLKNLEVLGGKFLLETNFPLFVEFSLDALSAKVQLSLEYDSAELCGEQVEAMGGYYAQTLEAIARESSERYELRSVLSEREQRQLLIKWNDTQADYPKNSSIHELFAAQTERTPDAVAAICENEQLTYRELNAKANQIAHYLQSLGVKPEVLVGICLERSLSVLVAILGILKVGAAYVPLDPAYPQERRSFMLADAKVPVLLTQKNLLETLPEHSAKVVCIDAEWQEISRQSDRNPAVKVEAERLAYVLYTSGSTGTPKGVLGTHRGTVNRCFWNPYPFIEADICCQKTSLNFVDSVWEIFGPLLHGLPTVIIPDRSVKDLNQFLQTLSKQNVTRLVLVPSLLRALLNSFPDLDRRLPQLKYWICSGETLPLELGQQFREQMPQRVLINLYGSSEVAADVTWYDATHCVEKVPIGRPIANTQIYLLDRNLQPVPIGSPGEIYVGGDGLAQGYLNRPELTSEKFISNPFGQEKLDFLGNSHQKILFKTGDIGCYLPDGNIEFLGRGDCQVKIRGFRIELGEIEAALSQHSSVSTAAVLLQENAPGSQRLVAYLVPNPGFRNQYPEVISELRSFLKHKLPDYMVPSAFVLLDALPLTPNGKIDRLALSQKCDYVSDETAFTEAQTPTEEEIAEIWTALLGLEKVGTNQNFFDLGGHSLMATQLISRVRSCFGVELALCDFFGAPTIQNLAELVEEEILANADSNQIDELLDLLEKSDGESAQTVMLTE